MKSKDPANDIKRDEDSVKKNGVPAPPSTGSDPTPAIYREHPQEYREWVSRAPDEHEQWKTRLAESGIDSILTEEEQDLLEKNRILVSRLDDEDIREIKKVGLDATVTDRGWTHWVLMRQKEKIGEEAEVEATSPAPVVAGDPLTRMLAEKAGDDQVSEWAMAVLFTTADRRPRIRLCDDPKKLSLWRGGRWHEVEAVRVGNQIIDIALKLVRTHPGLEKKERAALVSKFSSNAKQKNILEKMRGDIPPHTGTQSLFLVADKGEDFILEDFFSDPDEDKILGPVRVMDIRTGGVRDAKIEDDIEHVLPLHFPDTPYITPGETDFGVIYESFETRCMGASRLFADTGSYMVDGELVRDCTWGMHMLARIGQIFCHDLSSHDFLLFLGSGGNGKSLMKRLIERCAAGRSWTASDRLFSIKNKNHSQEVGKMRGKLGVFVEEVTPRDFNHLLLNQASSGETLSYEIKGGENMQFTPTATIVLLCNKVPDFPPESHGSVGRRMVPIPFDIVFGRDISPREDHDILAGVEPEIPDLVYHALCMYTAVKKAGHFPVCERVEALKASIFTKKEVPDKAAQVASFAEECLEITGRKTEYVVSHELYGEYAAYAARTGGHPVILVHQGQFSKILIAGAKRRGLTIKSEMKRVEDTSVKNPTRCLVGVRMKGPDPDTEEVPAEIVEEDDHGEGGCRDDSQMTLFDPLPSQSKLSQD